jgi:hypothetical protein
MLDPFPQKAEGAMIARRWHVRVASRSDLTPTPAGGP